MCDCFFKLSLQDSEVFGNAESFNPDRWLQGDNADEIAIASTGKIPLSKDGKALSATSVFLPFGGGPTFCPGRRFARNEIKTILVYFIRHFDLTLAASQCPMHSKSSSTTDDSLFSSPFFPGFDGSRAGLGIFPPKKDCDISIARRNN